MGLENFKTEDSTKSRSKSTNSSKRKSSIDSIHRPPQLFDSSERITPREIKYQIKSYNAGWSKQYSMLRSTQGEVVFFTAGINGKEQDKTLMVFTTIQSITSEESSDEELDIWVVPWNLDNSDNIEEGTYISIEDDWKEKLYNTIGEYIEKLDIFKSTY